MAVKSIVLTVGLAAMAAAAQAQVAQKPALTLDAAKKIAAAAVTEARKDPSAGAVIAIVDDGGNPVYLERLDNTFAAGANISLGKARTAALFKRPTRVFEEIIKNGRTAMVALNDFTPLQGGIPIEFEGKIIGGIGVSGAANQQRDEEVAIAGANAAKALAAGTSAPSASGAEVSYFESQKVAASFEKGAILFDGSDGRNYMVHTSRRDGPGQAEVHLKDADVIHVVDGAATFVTGGAVVEGKNIAPDEIRGSSIQGGETRRIGKGDVIIVPAGTPHWFKEVQGPLYYYVVKVR